MFTYDGYFGGVELLRYASFTRHVEKLSEKRYFSCLWAGSGQNRGSMSDGRSRAVARTKVAVIWTEDQYCVKRCGFCTVIISYDVPNNGGIMGNSPSGMASRQITRY